MSPNADEETAENGSIMDKLVVAAKVLAWFMNTSYIVFSVIGIFPLSFFLVFLGIWKFGSCNMDSISDIPVVLIGVGITIFLISLQMPFFYLARSKARKEKTADGTPLTGDVTTAEINRQMKCAGLLSTGKCLFSAILWITLPYVTYQTFRGYGEREKCDPLVYWTMFAICCVFLALTLLFVLFSISCCCFCCVASIKESREEKSTV